MAPVLQSKTVAGATLTLSYDEALDEISVPAKGAFTVKVGGTVVELHATDAVAVAVAGSAVTLTLAEAVAYRDGVTVTYTVPTGAAAQPIRDLAGNAAAHIPDTDPERKVDNRTPLMLTRATVGSDTLVLFYDRALDTTSVPATADFTVTVAGSGRGVTGVEVRTPATSS